MKFGRVQSAVTSHGKTVRTSLVLVAVALVTFLAMTGSPFASGTFNPTITFETSTTRASAHPDARITIDTGDSSEVLKGMTISLPKGFWGSLAAATKCTGTAADPNNANFGNCPAGAQIGTVTNVAEIDSSTARLRGQVFLADASAAGATAAANDPASILIKIHPKLGAVVFKDIVLAARAQVRYGPTGAGSATDAVGPVQGINTIVDNIPTQATDDDGHYAPVSFRLKTVQIDLKSRVEDIATKSALLTNPSSCAAATSLDASFTSYGGPTASGSVPYQATDCSTVKFNPTANFATIPSTPTAGGDAQLTSTISLPADNGSGIGSFNRIVVKLPPELGANLGALGSAGTHCAPSAAANGLSSFSPTGCPTSARIGTATINTPMLPDPVIGDVYLIDRSPIPWLGIDVSPTATNPSPNGVIIRLVGQATTATLLNQACEDSGCQAQVSATFINLPDAPVSNVALTIAPPDNRGGSGLSGKLFTVASSGHPTCLPQDEFTAAMTGTAVTAATAAVNRVSTLNVTGCAATSTSLTTGPYGLETTSTSPTFNFTDGASLQCSIDNPTPFDTGDGPSVPPTTPCSTSFTPTGLSIGLHRFFVSGGARPLERSFVVKSGVTPDNTPPGTTIDSGPADNGSTTDTTPSFTFSSNEGSSTFDCAVDDAAFLPCTSPYTSPALTTGASHTFEVRATDSAGNLDITSAKRTFDVDVPFAPSVTVTPSTNVARAHPSLDVALSNLSAENIKDLKLAMPNGFFGGLTGVAQVCTVAQATPVANIDGTFPAPGCPAASQVGTVSTHAVVLSDDGITPSDINIDGKVFLTGGFVSGEPAGLLVSVQAKVSTVDLGYINVPIRLAVREHALGIDTLAFNLPKSITSVDGITNFQLRDLVMHIDTGAGAPRPLLTNPSSCGAAAFSANFTGYDSNSANSSSPFQVTGCSGLPFAPALSLTLKNNAGGAPGPSDNIKRVPVNLDANMTSNPDGAGISGATLTMPHGLTIDVQHLPVPCAAEQAALDACPASTIIGTATATTPLLATPLSGNVYELKADPSTGSTLPRVLVALRGVINTDLVATNKFTPSKLPQIVTTFDTLPDAPLSTFSMHVGNGFLATRSDVCDDAPDAWGVIGTLGGYNGASSPVNIPQTFDCPQAWGPIVSYNLKKKKSKTTLTANVTAQTGKKLKKKLTLSLPKGLTFIKSGFTKKKLAKLVTVKVDGKKLKTSCFKKKSPTKFQVTFCKKSGKTISISFRAGTLIATKKLAKTPQFKMTAVDSDNKAKTVKTVTG